MKTAAKMLLGLMPGLRLSGGAPPKAHLAFDGDNDNLVVTQATSINNLGNGNFTVDFVAWIDRTQNSNLVSKLGASTGWYLGVASTWLQIELTHFDANNYAAFALPNDQVFRHYAVTWNATTHDIKMFVNGVEQSYEDTNTSDNGAYQEEGTVNMVLWSNNAGSVFTEGAMRWFRISDTVRWTSNFTAPSLNAAPDTDGDTVLLLKLDEGTGTPADSSGNEHGITLNGATWGP